MIELDPAYILHTSGLDGPAEADPAHPPQRDELRGLGGVGVRADARRTGLTNHSSHHTCFATFDYYAAARAGATTVILTPAVLMMPAQPVGAPRARAGDRCGTRCPPRSSSSSLRGDLEARDLRSIRWVLFAGRDLSRQAPAPDPAAAAGARFSHVCGSTEVNVCTCYHLPETWRSPAARCQSARRLLDGEHPGRRTPRCSPCRLVRWASCSCAGRR
ncbi:MAG: hypothetical protein MZW92_28035 [Comamonadaceae bacterium]|nr:hypothetical protein [Comamonadaceae bacterium]